VYSEEGDDRLVAQIQELARSIEKLPPIELWLHQRVGVAASHVLTLASRDRSPRLVGKESNDPTPRSSALRRPRRAIK
jgi:hypothetical protein